jgi:hypothetical protein
MVPPTFALVVNKKNRIKMRGALENGKRISLPTRRESYDPLANEELDAVLTVPSVGILSSFILRLALILCTSVKVPE